MCSGDTSEIYYPRITEDIKNFIKAGNTNPLDVRGTAAWPSCGWVWVN